MESPKEYYLVKSVEELKADQKIHYERLEQITKEFYAALQDHMDKEDERWIHVQNSLSELKSEDMRLGMKVDNHSGIFNRLWVVIIPVVISVLSHIGIAMYGN